jgi:hypothetical protein
MTLEFQEGYSSIRATESRVEKKGSSNKVLCRRDIRPNSASDMLAHMILQKYIYQGQLKATCVRMGISVNVHARSSYYCLVQLCLGEDALPSYAVRP